ncbi:UNVERIFIED_CONTAM: hypothetical protein FKN15_012744 [Acipenser sinensis]
MRNCTVAGHPKQNYIIPPGDLLMLSPFWAHRDPRYFPEPEKFMPERWKKANLEKNVFLEGFVAFGGGRYQCPGRWYALMEIQMFIGLILYKYELTLLDSLPKPWELSSQTDLAGYSTNTDRVPGMKGEPLFRGMRDDSFYRDFRLLEGERVFVPQRTDRQYALGPSFHQITDFNDLPTSLFACNVHQSVFEEKGGKQLEHASSETCSCQAVIFHTEDPHRCHQTYSAGGQHRSGCSIAEPQAPLMRELQCKNHNHWNIFNQKCSNSTGDTGVKLFKHHFQAEAKSLTPCKSVSAETVLKMAKVLWQSG